MIIAASGTCNDKNRNHGSTDIHIFSMFFEHHRCILMKVLNTFRNSSQIRINMNEYAGGPFTKTKLL